MHTKIWSNLFMSNEYGYFCFYFLRLLLIVVVLLVLVLEKKWEIRPTNSV